MKGSLKLHQTGENVLDPSCFDLAQHERSKTHINCFFFGLMVRTLPDFHFGRLDAVDAGQFTFKFVGDQPSIMAAGDDSRSQ